MSSGWSGLPAEKSFVIVPLSFFLEQEDREGAEPSVTRATKPYPVEERLAAPDEKRLLTTDELAEALNVTKSWLYSRTSTNSIPHIHFGGILRFQLQEVLDWAQEHGEESAP